MEYFLVVEGFVPIHALIEDLVEILFLEMVVLFGKILLVEGSSLAVLHEYVVVLRWVHFDWNYFHEILLVG